MTELNIDEIDNLDDVFDRGDEDEERGPAYRREPFWYLKNEGDISIIRPLVESPDWLKVKTHRFFPTGPKPADLEKDAKWPSAMPATCRADERLKKFFPGGCPIDSSGFEGKFGKGSKAEDVRYTLAVEREEYMEPSGRKALRDKTVDVPVFDENGKEIEGETMTLPSLVVVAETMWRMMAALKSSGEALGSLCRQDFRCKLIQNPSGNGKIVQVIPLAPTPDIQPGTKHWEMYEAAQQLWVPGGLSVSRLVLERAKDVYWKKFFLAEDGRTHEEHRIKAGGSPKEAPDYGDDAKSSGGGSSSSGGGESVDPEYLKRMRERIAKQS